MPQVASTGVAQPVQGKQILLPANTQQAIITYQGMPSLQSSNFPAPQTVETGAIVREMVLVQQDVGSKSVHISRSTRRTDSYDTRVPTRGVTECFSLLDRLEHGSRCGSGSNRTER